MYLDEKRRIKLERAIGMLEGIMAGIEDKDLVNALTEVVAAMDSALAVKEVE